MTENTETEQKPVSDSERKKQLIKKILSDFRQWLEMKQAERN